MGEMAILLIWELVPEETKFFKFEDCPDDIYAAFKKANGGMLGAVGDEDVETSINLIGDYLEAHKELEIDVNNLPTSGPYGEVFHTGVLL